MNREEYLATVIEAYLDSPDTPEKARARDWAVATDFWKHNIEAATVVHAVRLATLRRHRRDPALEPLEPIRSLAYMRPLVEHIHRQPHDPGYVDHVHWSYVNQLDWPFDEESTEKCG